MKKLITLALILIASFADAQIIEYCKKQCVPLPVPYQTNMTGVSAGVYEFKTDSAVVIWQDGDAVGFCPWSWNNPAYVSGYTVAVYQDGKPFIEQKHYTVHGPFATNIQDQNGAGPFHYYHPVSAGHTYSIQVGKECNDGTIAWSTAITYTTAPLAPVVPAGVNPAQNRSKKK